MTLKESLGFAVLSLLIPSVLLCLQAGCTTHPPTASERQRLQGKWEGVVVGQKSDVKTTITITGHSLFYQQGTNSWFETAFTLPAGTDPQQLHATIKGCSEPDSIGKVVVAILKIEDGILTLAMNQYARLEAPKSFEGNEEKGTIRYEFRKVQPQKKNTDYPNPNEPKTPNHALQRL